MGGAERRGKMDQPLGSPYHSKVKQRKEKQTATAVRIRFQSEK